jgi:hypothetical protein
MFWSRACAFLTANTSCNSVINDGLVVDMFVLCVLLFGMYVSNQYFSSLLIKIHTYYGHIVTIYRRCSKKGILFNTHIHAEDII